MHKITTNRNSCRAVVLEGTLCLLRCISEDVSETGLQMHSAFRPTGNHLVRSAASYVTLRT